MTERSGHRVYLALDDAELLAQCRVDVYRASGPGGQKRNKTSSAVRLRHQPTGLASVAVEDRSQHVNKKRAIRRLRESIALHVRCSIALDDYEPDRLLCSYVTADGRLRVNPKNRDYFPVAAEVLDVLHACGTRVRDGAAALGMSTAHLVKFLRSNPHLWNHINRQRQIAGQKRLGAGH